MRSKAATAGVILYAMNLTTSDATPLPDPLTSSAGNLITMPSEWQKIQRPEILDIFRENIYGRAPIGRPDSLRFDLKEIDYEAMEGMATLKCVDINFSGPGGDATIRLTVFIPNATCDPAPGFVLICNRSRDNIDPARKNKSPFWPAERIVERGYMAATFHNSDLAPDRPDMFHKGVHGIFETKNDERAPDAWGAISAWAWGASRVMDYFEADQDIDETRIGVVGHSRGGKAALWCGAEDERFAMVVSNNSGSTGAALARRRKGETIAVINKAFPHWFCANYKMFNDKEEALPVDQHQLIALIAPRLTYVASAAGDAWADPKGEFLSCVHAAPVYNLFGLQGVGTDDFPQTCRPLHTGHIGYHLRSGGHDLTEYDWDRFMDFADRHWKQGQ
jgi:dienelactone hydrolase